MSGASRRRRRCRREACEHGARIAHCAYRLLLVFFEPLPVDVGRLTYSDATREMEGPPRHVVGRVLPAAVLAVTHEAAIVLESGLVYPDGLVLRFGARIRRSITPDNDTSVSPSFHWHWPPRAPDAGFIDIGVRYSDGTSFTNTAHGSPRSLRGLGGHGSAREAWFEFWVSRAPPDGTFEIWTRWVGAGLGETVTDIPLTEATPQNPTALW